MPICSTTVWRRCCGGKAWLVFVKPNKLKKKILRERSIAEEYDGSKISEINGNKMMGTIPGVEAMEWPRLVSGLAGLLVRPRLWFGFHNCTIPHFKGNSTFQSKGRNGHSSLPLALSFIKLGFHQRSYHLSLCSLISWLESLVPQAPACWA